MTQNYQKIEVCAIYCVSCNIVFSGRGGLRTCFLPLPPVRTDTPGVFISTVATSLSILVKGVDPFADSECSLLRHQRSLPLSFSTPDAAKIGFLSPNGPADGFILVLHWDIKPHRLISNAVERGYSVLRDSSACLLWFRLSVVFNEELSVRQFPGWWRKVAALNFYSFYNFFLKTKELFVRKQTT